MTSLVAEVFTPSSSAVRTFVPRGSIQKDLDAYLDQPGLQVALFGPTGSGKSTLLRNMFSFHPARGPKRVALRTSCEPGMTADRILHDALARLGVMFPAEATAGTTRGFGGEASVAALFGAKGSYLGSTTRSGTERPVVQPLPSAQLLAEQLGQRRCCWIVEDSHKLSPKERQRLGGVMKVFVDVASEFPELHLIATGAVPAGQLVMESNQDLRHRIRELAVPLMTPDELISIMTRAEGILNITIPANLKRAIAAYSSGLPAVTHTMCLNMCLSLDIKDRCEQETQIPTTLIRQAVLEVVRQDSIGLRGTFDRITDDDKDSAFSNRTIVLKALACCPEEGGTKPQILDQVMRFEAAYPRANLSRYLNWLTAPHQSEVISYTRDTDRFAFTSPITRMFALDYFDLPEELESTLAELEARVTGSHQGDDPLAYDLGDDPM